MFVINVFGLGVLFRVLELPVALVSRIQEEADKAKVVFSDVIFDFELLENCGFLNFTNLPILTEGIGAIISKETLLEIRQHRKKIKNFPLNDLYSTDYLFPMYHINFIDFNIERKVGFNYYFLYQIIKGRVMKFHLDSFKGMDMLTFETSSFAIQNQSFDLLTSIQQEGKVLPLENDDSLVVEQLVLKL
jgi:hypothetical protein